MSEDKTIYNPNPDLDHRFKNPDPDLVISEIDTPHSKEVRLIDNSKFSVNDNLPDGYQDRIERKYGHTDQDMFTRISYSVKESVWHTTIDAFQNDENVRMLITTRYLGNFTVTPLTVFNATIAYRNGKYCILGDDGKEITGLTDHLNEVPY